MNKFKGIKLPSLEKLKELGKQELKDETIETLNAESQCLELLQTVRCKLAPSSVHGIGVFTIRDIKKGEELYCSLKVPPRWYNISFANLKKYFNQTRPEILRLILDRWPIVVNGASFLSPNYDSRLVSFINHSNEPNYNPITDTAIKDIPAGQEVFEDYRIMPNYKKAFPFLA